MVRMSEEEVAAILKRQKKKEEILISPPKRKRGQRGPSKQGLSKSDPPINDIKGKLSKCPDCEETYLTAKRRYSKPHAGMEFNYFRCKCGHEFDRYR